MSSTNETGGSLPIIDLSLLSGTEQQRQALTSSLTEACLHTGFFYIREHGIPPELIDQGVTGSVHPAKRTQTGDPQGSLPSEPRL